MLTTTRRAVLFAATLICASLAIAAQAHADTPLQAFCIDNAYALKGSMGESGLDPATWASDPKNLFQFGFSGPGDINTLYHMVIDKGAPAITSYWSNENGNVEWRCQGQ